MSSSVSAKPVAFKSQMASFLQPASANAKAVAHPIPGKVNKNFSADGGWLAYQNQRQ